MNKNTLSSSGSQESSHKMTYGEGWGCLARNTCSTVNVTEARQGGFPKKIDVFICSLVEMLHHILLKEERMVSTHRASGVKELLVIVAHVRLALGWEELGKMTP